MGRTMAEVVVSADCSPHRNGELRYAASFPQHFLYFFPLPHGHGSLRPTFGASFTICRTLTGASSSPPPPAGTISALGTVAGWASASATPYPPTSSWTADDSSYALRGPSA